MQSMALFSRLESNRASITGNLRFVNISSVFISQSGVKNPSGWHRDYCSCYLGMQKKNKKSGKNGLIKFIVIKSCATQH